MDRANLSAAIIADAGETVMALLRDALPRLLTADLAGLERHLQALSRVLWGHVVEEIIDMRAQDERGAPTCASCGRPMRRVEAARPRQMQGLVGDDTLRRAYYHCASCGQGQAPLDAALGVGRGALSPELLRVVCRAGVEEAFAEAADLVREALGVWVSADSAERATERMGAVAEAAQQEAMARARRGEMPAPPEGAPDGVVAVDGCQAHLEDGWHEIKVGRVAPLGPRPRRDRRSGRAVLAWGASAVCAGLEGAEDFWWRVYVTACRGGWGRRTRRVVVLGDGAAGIWARAAHFLGGVGRVAIEILDIFHAYEHPWEAGRAVFLTPAALAAWVEPLEDALYERGAPAVLAALAALTPPDAAAAAVLQRERAYFAENAARMDYPRFVAQQLPIGSGAVESLCKTLIEARTKGAGMRWTPAGVQAVVTLRALRALRASGAWAGFWATHPLRERLRLCPPARPRRRATAVAPGPPADARPLALPAPTAIEPPPAPLVPAVPNVPARRPAATHPWRRAPIGRARCA